jgi:hypothetical protein
MMVAPQGTARRVVSPLALEVPKVRARDRPAPHPALSRKEQPERHRDRIFRSGT